MLSHETVYQCSTVCVNFSPCLAIALSRTLANIINAMPVGHKLHAYIDTGMGD